MHLKAAGALLGGSGGMIKVARWYKLGKSDRLQHHKQKLSRSAIALHQPFNHFILSDPVGRNSNMESGYQEDAPPQEGAKRKRGEGELLANNEHQHSQLSCRNPITT